MPQLLIRDLPDEINAALEAAAASSRRSKEKQALFLLETALRRPKGRLELLARIRRNRNEWKGKPATMEEILKATEEAH